MHNIINLMKEAYYSIADVIPCDDDSMICCNLNHVHNF